MRCLTIIGIWGILIHATVRSVAQLGSALASGARGRWFKSSRSDHIRAHSSAVEQPAHNRSVPGSIPGGPTNYIKGRGTQVWPKGADCKSAGKAFAGSNPALSTIMGRSQAVRHGTLDPVCVGSTPTAPTNIKQW